MVFRKIIGFGDSSFVVSLPKKWVVANALKKGDVVNMEEEGHQVKITPGTLKQSSEQTNIKFNFDGDLKKIKSEIFYAYINGFTNISILGDKVHDNLDKMKEIIGNFMYLDIVDQSSPNKIVLHTSMNLFDVSVYDILRRMDRIVMSMAEDVTNYLTGKNTNVKSLLVNKEQNLNKLCNLVFKTLKSAFNPSDRAILNLDMNDIFYYWELALFIERTGNQLKRVPRYCKSKTKSQLIKIFEKSFQQYKDAMKSNFTRDRNLAVSVVVNKKKIYDEIDQIVGSLPKEYVVVAQKIGIINTFGGNIATSLLRLHADLKK